MKKELECAIEQIQKIYYMHKYGSASVPKLFNVNIKSMNCVLIFAKWLIEYFM